MKYYLGVSGKSPKRGYNRRILVYSIKKNVLDCIGFVDVNTASYKGDESTVFDFLMEKELISDKTYNSHNGYYIYQMKETHGLSIQVV